MKKNLPKIIIILFCLLQVNTFAQFDDSKYSLTAFYHYSTNSKLFLFPNAKDEFLRNQNIELNSVKGYSLEFRYRISKPLVLGVNLEYMRKLSTHNQLTVGGIRLQMEDGFIMIPLEFNLYYHIPFSNDKFHFYMGGGVGLYFAKQKRSFGDISISDNGTETAYGIQISIGLDYYINEFISVRGEMKFRDPEFDLKSKYDKTVFHYQGRALLLSRETFETKVNLDGVNFSAGVSFRL